MHKIKEKLMDELYEYEEKLKKSSGGKLTAGDLQTIHTLTDTIKNICKIYALDEEMEGGSSYEEYGSSYARGGGRGRGRNARRDSMGRYSREDGMEGGSSYREGGSSYRAGGSSYRGGSSYEDGGSSYERGGSSYARGGRGGSSRDAGKEYMIERLEEMMDEASMPKEREAIKKCIMQLENA